MGIKITKTPPDGENTADELSIAAVALDSRKSLGIFLLNDGVWVGKVGNDDKAIGSGASPNCVIEYHIYLEKSEQLYNLIPF